MHPKTTLSDVFGDGIVAEEAYGGLMEATIGESLEK
jgi:hypothetical protein